MIKRVVVFALLAALAIAQTPKGCIDCGAGAARVLATYGASGLSGAVTAFDLVASAQGGLYQISRYSRTTAVAGGTCTTTATLTHTENGYSGSLTSTINLNSLNSVGQVSTIVYADNATAIQFSTTAPSGAGCSSGTARYNYYISVLQLF